MVLTNSVVDPYSPSEGYFECLECGFRETTGDRLAECPDCDGRVRNIAVARE